jgi:hypothetical protein
MIEGWNACRNSMQETIDPERAVCAAGIKVEGEDKWLTLIQNASKAKS